MIEIRQTANGETSVFDVTLREGVTARQYQVTLSSELSAKLTHGKHTPEQLIDAAFRFLLEREPKEAILSRFDVGVTARYFPEFEREIGKYLAKPG